MPEPVNAHESAAVVPGKNNRQPSGEEYAPPKSSGGLAAIYRCVRREKSLNVPMHIFAARSQLEARQELLPNPALPIPISLSLTRA